jgi:hypothetical protein
MHLRVWFCALVLAVLLLPAGPRLAHAQDIHATNTVNTLANDPTTGTRLNRLAKVTSAGTVVQATTADTSAKLVVVIAGAGTTGSSVYVEAGDTVCEFDNATTNKAGTHVVASTSADGVGNGGGRCHQQDAAPANGMSMGTLLATSTVVGGVARISLQPIAYIPGSVSGTGVNTGIVQALAYYDTTSTVNDVPGSATASAGAYPKFSGTAWGVSTGTAAGVGVCTNQVVTATNTDAPPTCAAVTAAMTTTAIAKTGVDIDTTNQVTGATGAFAWRGTASPAPLNGPLNDYALPPDTVLLRLDPGAADRDFTGAQGGVQGRILLIRNVSATRAVVLRDQSTASLASNRWALGADVVVQPLTTTPLIYDAAGGVNRWVPVASALPKPQTVKLCDDDLGDVSVNAVPLTDDQDTPTTCGNRYGRDIKLTAVLCKSDAGTPTIRPILTGGTATSLVTADCTCGTTWTACSLATAPLLHSFDSGGTSATCSTPPCTIDDAIVSAGGTVKRLQRSFVGELQ